MSLFQELTDRGLVEQSSSPEIPKILESGPITFYVGYDPTADSLHVGSLVPLVTQVRLARAGHRPIAVVGGATGMVGDPSETLLATEDDTIVGFCMPRMDALMVLPITDGAATVAGSSKPGSSESGRPTVRTSALLRCNAHGSCGTSQKRMKLSSGLASHRRVLF